MTERTTALWAVYGYFYIKCTHNMGTTGHHCKNLQDTFIVYNQVTNRNLFRYKSFSDRVIEARQGSVETFIDNYPLRLHPNTD